MNAAYTGLLALAGAAAGWGIFVFVGRYAAPTGWLEKPATVILAGAAIAGLSLKFGLSTPQFLAYTALVLVLAGVALFDLRRQIIPHSVTVPGTLAGLLTAEWLLRDGWRDSALGATVGAAVLLTTMLVQSLRKKEIGGGDWKYAAMLGSFVGIRRIALALLFGGILGLIAGLILLTSAKATEKPQALGPWLSMGAVASLLLR